MKKIIVLLLISFSVLFAQKTQSCENKTFSLNAYDVEGNNLTLLDIVSDLTKQCGITVIFEDKRSHDKLAQNLSLINIKDYSLTQLFELLFNEHNLFYEYNKYRHILRVSYYKVKNFNVNYVNMSEFSTKSVKSITVGTNPIVDGGDSSGSSEENSNSDITKVTTSSRFTFWTDLKEHVEQILKTDEDYDAMTNKVLVNRDAAIVTATGTKKQLREIRSYLSKIQKRMHKQVMIEAYIIELTYNHNDSKGIDWSKFQLDLMPKLSFNDAKGLSSLSTWSFASNFNPTAVVKFLGTYGDVDIISNPKILTLNNQPAVINIGNQLSYIYQSGDISTTGSGSSLSSSNSYNLGSTFIGLSLNIIPEVTEYGHIMMRINPVTSALLNEEELTKYSSTTSSTKTARNMPPDTKIRQMSSIVKVKDGQKVMIGGLIEKRLEDDSSKVPLLGDIPILGRAFSHTTKKAKKTELFIVLTPTLIKNNKFPSLNDYVKSRID